MHQGNRIDFQIKKEFGCRILHTPLQTPGAGRGGSGWDLFSLGLSPKFTFHICIILTRSLFSAALRYAGAGCRHRAAAASLGEGAAAGDGCPDRTPPRGKSSPPAEIGPPLAPLPGSAHGGGTGTARSAGPCCAPGTDHPGHRQHPHPRGGLSSAAQLQQWGKHICAIILHVACPKILRAAGQEKSQLKFSDLQ